MQLAVSAGQARHRIAAHGDIDVRIADSYS
jgi:hypothetical protein